MTEDVVVYLVDRREDGLHLMSWGRGTLADAEQFCADPKPPASKHDWFVAVDGWGHGTGTIVAATEDLKQHIGRRYSQYRAEVTPVRAS